MNETAVTVRGRDPSVPLPPAGVPALSVRGLTKSYGHVRALRGASFEAYAGEVTALVGDNGAGKSTLIKCVAGVVQPEEGTIEVNGAPVTMTDPQHATQLGIETVYQDLALAPDLDAAANVFLGREVRRMGFLHNQPEMRRRTARSFQELGVGTVQDLRAPVAAFSGGQRQSVAIARAAMWAKHVIVMDEPTAALGVKETAQVLDLIRRLKADGKTIILVSHNMADVVAVATRVAIFKNGRKVIDRPVAGLDADGLAHRVMTGRDV